MYYLNILYCNVLSEDSCPASGQDDDSSVFQSSRVLLDTPILAGLDMCSGVLDTPSSLF